MSGRITAAIEILADFTERRIPLKTAIADWGRNNRYAGAKDRAWISGLCLDVLRRRESLTELMGTHAPRGLVFGVLRFLWKTDLVSIRDSASEEPYGPGSLSYTEEEILAQDHVDLPAANDFPEWLSDLMERRFGSALKEEAMALCARADVDLRLNTLKAEPEKTLTALKSVKAKAVSGFKTTARIDAPDPSEKAPAVTIIPAFNKGWVEVQDLASQIAVMAAGEIKGKQVLDFCAGAGGKSLALAAQMGNTGQLHVYDIDARRLKPIYARAKRGGLRNLQIHTPERGGKDQKILNDLIGKMDCVFVDAPCTGSGTWRRHPDTKWRLTDQQLKRRQNEQDQVLSSAAKFVRPGGQLIYVTCSIFMEENEDRVQNFLNDHDAFYQIGVTDNLTSCGLVDEIGLAHIKPAITDQGALLLTPHRTGTDGFFVSALKYQ